MDVLNLPHRDGSRSLQGRVVVLGRPAAAAECMDMQSLPDRFSGLCSKYCITWPFEVRSTFHEVFWRCIRPCFDGGAFIERRSSVRALAIVSMPYKLHTIRRGTRPQLGGLETPTRRTSNCLASGTNVSTNRPCQECTAPSAHKQSTRRIVSEANYTGSNTHPPPDIRAGRLGMCD